MTAGQLLDFLQLLGILFGRRSVLFGLVCPQFRIGWVGLRRFSGSENLLSRMKNRRNLFEEPPNIQTGLVQTRTRGGLFHGPH